MTARTARTSNETLVLHPRLPFRFDLALAYLWRSPLEVLDVVGEGVYRRALTLNDSPRLIEVRAEGGVEGPALRVALLDGPATPADLEAARALVARCFRVDEDVTPLDHLAETDPPFGALVQRLRGLRALIMPSAFESLVWAITGQQINVAFAYKLKRVLIEQFGRRLEHGARTYFLFPDAERLARSDPDELRALQFSGQKARYIVDLARLIADGQLDLEGLRSVPPDKARATLMQLRGVGRWTAEYVLMRGLGARDELPAADIGLQTAAARLYCLDRRPTEPELRALAEPWTGWRTYYAFYLWFTLNPVASGRPVASSQHRRYVPLPTSTASLPYATLLLTTSCWLLATDVPFTLDDLDRIKVRMGTGEKSLRDMSDNQFTAWLRHIGAEGTMTVIKIAPGKFVTPLEDRVRILNELDASGFQIPGVTAPAEAPGARRPAHDPRKLEALQAALQAAATNIEVAQGLAQELGEIDPRVNLRQSLAGALALMDAARGATERALKSPRTGDESP